MINYDLTVFYDCFVCLFLFFSFCTQKSCILELMTGGHVITGKIMNNFLGCISTLMTVRNCFLHFVTISVLSSNKWLFSYLQSWTRVSNRSYDKFVKLKNIPGEFRHLSIVFSCYWLKCLLCGDVKNTEEISVKIFPWICDRISTGKEGGAGVVRINQDGLVVPKFVFWKWNHSGLFQL